MIVSAAVRVGDKIYKGRRHGGQIFFRKSKVGKPLISEELW